MANRKSGAFPHIERQSRRIMYESEWLVRKISIYPSATKLVQAPQNLAENPPVQFVAKSATNAGIASHRSPFTRKNMKPQNPSRLIQVFITLGRFDHAARTMSSAPSVSRTAGGSNDLTKI